MRAGAIGVLIVPARSTCPKFVSLLGLDCTTALHPPVPERGAPFWLLDALACSRARSDSIRPAGARKQTSL